MNLPNFTIQERVICGLGFSAVAVNLLGAAIAANYGDILLLAVNCSVGAFSTTNLIKFFHTKRKYDAIMKEHETEIQRMIDWLKRNDQDRR